MEVEEARVRSRVYLVRIERPRLFGVSATVLGVTVYPDVRSEIVDGFYYALPVKERTGVAREISLYGLLSRCVDEKGGAFQQVGLFPTSENDPLEIPRPYKPDGWDYERKRAWFDKTPETTWTWFGWD